MGQSPPSSTYNDMGNGLPFYQGKSEFGDTYPKPVKWCSEPNKVAELDDILISVRAPVGPTNLCPERSCIGRGLAAIRPLAGMPSRYFLYYLRYIEDSWDSKATGTTFKAISGSVLREQEIPLAPLAEQRRIVDVIEAQFTRLDAAVEALRRVQANLKRYRASVLKAACEGRLVPTEAELAAQEGRAYEPASVLLARILAERRTQWEAQEWRKQVESAQKKAAQAARRATGRPSRLSDLAPTEWQGLGEEAYGKYLPKNDKWKQKYEEPAGPDTSDLPDLPEGWVWASLGALLRESLRNGHSAKEVKDGNGIRTLTLTAVTLGQFSEANIKLTDADPSRVRDLWLQPGDILIERSNTPELVGTARLFNGPSGFAVFPDLLIRARVTKSVSDAYIEIVLHRPETRRYYQESAQGIAGSMPKISQTIILDTPIPLPPMPEQLRIVAEFDRCATVADSLGNTTSISNIRAERLRQAILKRAFEGKLVPQDANDEPASELLKRIRRARGGDPVQERLL